MTFKYPNTWKMLLLHSHVCDGRGLINCVCLSWWSLSSGRIIAAKLTSYRMHIHLRRVCNQQPSCHWDTQKTTARLWGWDGTCSSLQRETLSKKCSSTSARLMPRRPISPLLWCSSSSNRHWHFWEGFANLAVGTWTRSLASLRRQRQRGKDASFPCVSTQKNWTDAEMG